MGNASTSNLSSFQETHPILCRLSPEEFLRFMAAYIETQRSLGQEPLTSETVTMFHNAATYIKTYILRSDRGSEAFETVRTRLSAAVEDGFPDLVLQRSLPNSILQAAKSSQPNLRA